MHSWYLDPGRVTERLPITTAPASVLLVGREMGWRSWDMPDLDPLVTESTRRPAVAAEATSSQRESGN